MRILFVADAASIHTRRWLEYFRNRGDEVHVASFRYFEMPGVTIHLLPTFGLGKLGYFYALLILPRLFARVRPDLVHAHYLTSYGFLAALAGLRPLVVTAWGSDVLIAPGQSRLLRYFASYAVRHANAVTSLADHMNLAIAALGVPLESVTSTPFGVDTDFFKPEERMEGGGHKPLKLICTRNFDVIYDVGTLIRALEKVFSRGRMLQIDLVGDGPLRGELVDLARNLGIDSHIKFVGHVEHDVLAGLLAGADIFVTPALSDGNNVSLNEAMASGCFPIATDIPANAQWVKNDKNGYLYPPGSVDHLAAAIEAALDNNTLRAHARDENRQIAVDLVDWRICANRMENLYQGVVG
jgi:glycosyltransferase involved in cell wall biosynthesis